MLGLKGITKNYLAGDSEVQALKGIDIQFRQSEFVAVLGPSGCGKTTFLNIIGGLDRYTDGDLTIADKSTKEYKDRDWDFYRNHTIGFVFQTYNLIPHQTVLANVELALTLSGISKAERRERAKKMLERVGLGDQIHKRPNQMSGGQMQRVAIARALINDPEILLADEPTGALDTETSVQIMDLLKEIAKDRLVIMVTHNPELAEQYATRIIRLLDGKVQSDSMPYSEKQASADRKAALKKKEKEEKKKEKKEKKRVSMSNATAFSLSMNNLMTKKARTLLTSFAGSIGIIGISLILSLSDGFQTYINEVQENTLSSYPLSILSRSVDLSGIVENVSGQAEHEDDHPLDKVYSTGKDAELMNAMVAEVKQNDMEGFTNFLEENADRLSEYNIEYNYNIQPMVYLADTSEKITPVNPNPLVDAYYSMLGYDTGNLGSSYSQIMQMSTDGMDIWTLLYGDQHLLDEQYDVISGDWPKSKDEVILVVDDYNEVTGMTLYGLGLRDPSEISTMFSDIMSGKEIEMESVSYSYDELMNMQFRVILHTDYYEYDETEDCWKDRTRDSEYMAEKIEDGLAVHISGIVRKKSGAVTGALRSGTICYTQELVDYLLDEIADTDIVKQQEDNPDIDVFTGYEFENIEDVTIDDVYHYIDNMSEAEFAQMQGMFSQFYGSTFGPEEVVKALNDMSDEDLVAAFIPTMLEGITLDDAKAFAKSKEGQGALLMMLAEGDESKMDPKMLKELDDDTLLQMYSEIMASQITADAIRQKIADMNDDELNALAMAFNPAKDIESLKRAMSEMDEDMLLKIFKDQILSQNTSNTYDGNMQKLGLRDPDSPFSVMIYSPSFEAKEAFEDIIQEYNDKQLADGNEDGQIEYTDYIGILLSSVTKIINMVSYVLIGFVSISLVVSSIMIGIITYISVLERTKEIGILRSIGASKRDVSRVFNAETFIVGLVAGLIGVIMTIILDIPINIIIEKASGAPDIAFLRPLYAVILVAISVLLTLIAGIIPAKLASKKDPVIALRSE
ncbi:MAG: ABC transporter ATP-binding protein/permease [Oscillospiraceae bacterium]|nr:ABC transporter ATP-binding protein/permease [Oscillospiraceae bacterium]